MRRYFKIGDVWMTREGALYRLCTAEDLRHRRENLPDTHIYGLALDSRGWQYWDRDGNFAHDRDFDLICKVPPLYLLLTGLTYAR